MNQPRLGRRAYPAIRIIRNDPALQPQSVSFSPEIKPHVAGILGGHWSSNHPPIQAGTYNPYWTLNYFSEVQWSVWNWFNLVHSTLYRVAVYKLLFYHFYLFEFQDNYQLF